MAVASLPLPVLSATDDRPSSARGRAAPPPVPRRPARPTGTTPPPIPQLPSQPGLAAATATPTPDFAAVYDEHASFVWRSLRRLGVPERSLDDGCQDVFVVIHRRLGEFEGRSSLKSWIFGIARRVAHDHRRRVDRKERTEELPEAMIDPRAATPAADAERAEAVRALHDILAGMDDDKREVFVLAELEQMSVPEIADAIGVNINTVYSRLRAARQAFEQAIARRQARTISEGRGR